MCTTTTTSLKISTDKFLADYSDHIEVIDMDRTRNGRRVTVLILDQEACHFVPGLGQFEPYTIIVDGQIELSTTDKLVYDRRYEALRLFGPSNEKPININFSQACHLGALIKKQQAEWLIYPNQQELDPNYFDRANKILEGLGLEVSTKETLEDWIAVLGK